MNWELEGGQAYRAAYPDSCSCFVRDHGWVQSWTGFVLACRFGQGVRCRRLLKTCCEILVECNSCDRESLERQKKREVFVLICNISV